MVWAKNCGYFKPRGHSCASNTECIKQLSQTQPINCDIIAHKDTMILYMAQAP